MQSDPFETRSPFEKLADARKQRLLIATVNFVLLAVFPITLVFAVLLVINPSWQTIIVVTITAFLAPVLLLARWLARRGQTSVGGYITVTYMLLMTVTNGVLVEGFFTAVAPAYAPIIILSGMVLGARGAYITGGVASILWLAGWFSTAEGIIPTVSAAPVILTIMVAAIIAIGFGFTAFTSQLSIRDLRRALDDATYDLVQANRQLEEANQLKSQFMARTSHELRTPLNAIIGFTDLALREVYGPLTSLQQDGLQRVFSNAKRLLALINDILDLSKIEAGEMEIIEDAFALERLIETVEIALGPLAKAKNLPLNFFVSDEMPDVIVGDENRLSQILMNLVDNALKFTDEGRVDVIVSPTSDNQWMLQVRDTGRGIREEDYNRIFEEFRQAGVADFEKQGTGLGLAISRHLIQLMGGHITLDSQLGQGSVFVVTLPIKEPQSSVQGAKS